VITREFEPVTTPLDDVIEWALREARIRRGFADFVRAAQAEGWEVHVVSSGFEELITPILEREGVQVELHANRVDARSDGWRVEWRYPDDCDVCGESCKRSTLPLGEVVYVGDGYSDRCAALAADRVFATRGLASYLDEQGAPYTYFDDFRSIGQALASTSRPEVPLLRLPEPYDFELSTRATAPSAPTSRTSGTKEASIASSPAVRCGSRSAERRRGRALRRRDRAGRAQACSARRFDLDEFYAFAARSRPSARSRQTCAGCGRRSPVEHVRDDRHSITAQQVSLFAAFAIRNRLIERFGVRIEHAYAFPTRERLALAEPDEITAVGFSRRKAEYVIGLARSDLDLTASRSFPDDEIKAALTAAPGNRRVDGRLVPGPPPRRPSAWPAGDLGVRKAVERFYADGRTLKTTDVRAIGERLRPVPEPDCALPPRRTGPRRLASSP
jgi:2-hydroxy-3-keto-5-methylthiopentenyl-1-phosphate phosphatase/3-methyladenine DNA glycosylase/8-oxoguanine DNA glycosylase